MIHKSPIDKDRFRPAQAILTTINEIQKRGQKAIDGGKQPSWTDLQILNQIDAKEIGNAINASKYSMELVENFLYDYKFKNWDVHSDKSKVTNEEKKERSKEIAHLLCDHHEWKSHGRGINRELAWSKCKLKIIHPEDTINLDETIKKLWTLIYWSFENSDVYKVFISNNYAVFRSASAIIRGQK